MLLSTKKQLKDDLRKSLNTVVFNAIHAESDEIVDSSFSVLSEQKIYSKTLDRFQAVTKQLMKEDLNKLVAEKLKALVEEYECTLDDGFEELGDKLANLDVQDSSSAIVEAEVDTAIDTSTMFPVVKIFSGNNLASATSIPLALVMTYKVSARLSL